MPLVLSPASQGDAGRIAEIHMAAFESNVMLHAQFPTPAARKGLQKSVEEKVIADIDDARTTVLVVRDLSEFERRWQSKDGYLEQDVDEGREGWIESQVIAFAKWSHPVAEDEEYSEPEWVWRKGASMRMLDKWTKRTERAQNNAVGRTPCYRKFHSAIILQFSVQNCTLNSTPSRSYFHWYGSNIPRKGCRVIVASVGYGEMSRGTRPWICREYTGSGCLL